MDYTQFNTKCVGITIESWDYVLLGVYTFVDADWGMIAPIPDDNPLAKQVRFVDSEMYFRHKDLKLIKIIKNVETTKEAGPTGYGPKFDNGTGGNTSSTPLAR